MCFQLPHHLDLRIRAYRFLTKNGVLKNTGGDCKEFKVKMKLVSCKDRSDGIKWRCPKCKRHEKSVREGSIFSASRMEITILFKLFYYWAKNLDHKRAVSELAFNSSMVVDWYAK